MKLKVDGMHCAHCVRAVQQAVLSVAPEASPEVDLDAGMVTLQGSPDRARVVEAIQAEGYQAQPVDA